MTTALVLHPFRVRRLRACATARAAFKRPSAKTCRRGHRWTPENTLPIDQGGYRGRRCRACWLIACGRSLRKKRSELVSLKRAMIRWGVKSNRRPDSLTLRQRFVSARDRYLRAKMAA